MDVSGIHEMMQVILVVRSARRILWVRRRPQRNLRRALGTSSTNAASDERFWVAYLRSRMMATAIRRRGPQYGQAASTYSVAYDSVVYAETRLCLEQSAPERILIMPSHGLRESGAACICRSVRAGDGMQGSLNNASSAISRIGTLARLFSARRAPAH